MRTTPDLESDDGLSLFPVSRRLFSEMMEAHAEDPEGTYLAIPWFDRDVEASPQISDFLFELEVHSKSGRIHFWSIHEGEEFVGLVGIGDELQIDESQWNLGYWVRSSARRRGIARRSVDAVFTWVSAQSQPAQVEITVHPQNTAGLATCRSICTRWGGKRVEPDFWPIEIGGRTVPHAMWLVELGGV
ncbi:MAG: GNAT family N-acetyltransferase [Candidatus Poseidoniaceae archaeon]|jgi:RimJ/RimL family protein N-acetyltransferase|nr:GNAT family N-acetyltransferase [Candidatus Poseidoniaceae archaeon]MDP7001017.1 GNAT family N-acetyltransferase [Candidatus Poseidoniaceae archaeon]